jgi:hypothetical protein
MTEISADKRQEAAQPAAGEKTDAAVQDVFARQEDLFTVISTKKD